MAGGTGVPFIPEETIDRIEVGVDDIKEAVQAQTRAILMLSQRMNVQSELLTKIHEAVTKPADGEPLGELLKALIEAGQQHAAMLQAVLAEVSKPRV
jgi:uncharacterized membrane-anchored protein YjiN (DUF445 family)